MGGRWREEGDEGNLFLYHLMYYSFLYYPVYLPVYLPVFTNLFIFMNMIACRRVGGCEVQVQHDGDKMHHSTGER